MMLSGPRDVTDALRPGETIEWIGKPARIQREAVIFGWLISLLLALVFWIDPENTGAPLVMRVGIPAGVLAFVYGIGFWLTHSARFVITSDHVMVYGPGEDGFQRLSITPETFAQRKGGHRIGKLKIRNLNPPSIDPNMNAENPALNLIIPLFKRLESFRKSLPGASQSRQMTFFEIQGPETAETILKTIVARKIRENTKRQEARRGRPAEP